MSPTYAMMRRFARFAVLVATLFPSSAFAQLPPSEASPATPPSASSPNPSSNAGREAAAQALFDEAVKLMEQRRYPEACERFAASQKLDPGAGTLLNLGTCYEKNRQTASAWATFVEAGNVATRDGHPDWATRARERAQVLEPQLARVTVIVPPESAVDGLVVERDALRVDAGSYGSAIPVDPGQYTFSASAPGKKKGWSTTIVVQAGGRATVTIPELESEPPPLPAVVPAPPTQSSYFWSTGRIAGATVGAAGVIGVVVGSVLGVTAKSDYDSARNNDCPGGGTRCTPAGIALSNSATSLAAASTATFIVSGLALGTGVTLLLVSPRGGASTPQAASLTLVPHGTARGGGLGLEGTW